MFLKNLFQNRIVRFVLFLAVLFLFGYIWKTFGVNAAYYQELFSNYPTMSVLIFVLLYVGTTTFVWFGPKDILRISSAVFFGASVSTALVWIGEMINALIMFHLSRVLGQEFVAKRLRTKTKKLDNIKNDSSLLGVMALRINPLVPFRIMDLGYGLTRISCLKYLAGISVVSIVRIYWLQYILAEPGVNLFTEISMALNALMNGSAMTADQMVTLASSVFLKITDYFIENPKFLRYSCIYFLAVAIVTVIAVIARLLRKQKVTSQV